MKKILKYLLIVMILLSSVRSAYALEAQDMSKWSFKILLQKADQSDELKVVKFVNKESGRFGFCMEAGTDYSPRDSIYVKEDCDDKELFEIFKAFEMLGEDYYIAAQLMIWELKSGIRYSFDGKDAAGFGEEEIRNMIAAFKDRKSDLKQIDVKAAPGKETSISIEDLDDYEIAFSNVTILNTENEKITFIVDEQTENPRIELVPKYDEMKGSYRYHSETSQDIYSYEGDYEVMDPITIRIQKETGEFTVSFRKTDEGGHPISGAQFTVYEFDDNSDQVIYLINTGKQFDLYELFKIDESKTIAVSERYQKYFDGKNIKTDETGYFDCVITDDHTQSVRRVYVCKDLVLDKNEYRIKEAAVYQTKGNEIETIDHLVDGKHYILCESKPRNGYVFVNDPCVFIDQEKVEGEVLEFQNRIRKYDLRLYKENPEHSILLNGAKFSLRYEEDGKTKERIFVTGALNIRQKNDKKYVLYRHEKDGNIYVGEFTDGYFIKEDAIPGKYYYCLSDDTTVNDSSLLNRETEVILGAFEIDDLPYDSSLHLTELKAPKGYYIEEAEFKIDPDLDYSLITFKNYRVNEFEIIQGKKRKIPKTCIGD